MKNDTILGRLVMDSRRLLTLDVDEVLEKAKEKAKQVRQWILK